MKLLNKQLISLMLLGILCFALIGCESKDVVNVGVANGETDNFRFVPTGDSYKIGDIKYKTYYDSRTNIVYMADTQSYRSGITLMYDKDGKPITLDKYNQSKQNKGGTDSSRFVPTGDSFQIGGIKYKTYYDSKTNIIYMADPQSYRSGITLMYDKDGKPAMFDNYKSK